jgi:hypothetical protein
VCFTRFVYFVSLLIFVAIMQSQFNLSLMAHSHLALVSLFVCYLFHIILSHLNTHVRWAVSEIRICRSLEASLCLIGVCGWRGASLLFALCLGKLMHPAPIIMPRSILGHCSRLCGHVCLAIFQAVGLVFAGH